MISMLSLLSSSNLQLQMDRTLTNQDLCRGFRVSVMALHNWRKHRGLPAIVIGGGERPTIRFVPEDVQKWARENGVTWYPV